MTNRVRVLLPFDPRGTVIFHGLVGVMLNLPAWIFGLLFGGMGGVVVMLFAGGMIKIVSLILLIGIPLAMAVRLSSRCQSKLIVFRSGVAFGACFWASWFLAMTFAPGSSVALSTSKILGTLLFVMALMGAVYGAGYLLVRWLFCQSVYRIETQDGALCWKCAYRVGNPPISDRCPECGTPIHSPTRRPSAWSAIRARIKRRSRIMASVVLTALAILLVARAVHVRSEVAPFVKGVAGETVFGSIMQIDRSAAPPRWCGGWEAAGKWRKIPSDPSKVLVVYYIPIPTGAQPAMQVQLTGITNDGRLPIFGNPAITCDLSPEQASQVLMHDVPQSLIDAMLQEAVKAKWVPMPAGGMVGCVDVSPEGHFPVGQ